MELKIKGTTVLERTVEAFNDESCRFIVHQGGSRSSKTISILQFIIIHALTNPGITISIVRKSLPSLRESAMRDFFDILGDLNLYEEKLHNKTSHSYRFKNGSVVEFFSIDDSQKIRGRSRDLLFMNEANELDRETYVQLVMRTRGKVIIDFNPSQDEFHWLNDLIKQDNSTLIKSTFLDNPFLPEEQVEFIKNLIRIDENYYRIYALGEMPTVTSRIYSHFRSFRDLPIEKPIESNYGLDIGYNHASALVRCDHYENSTYIRQIIHKSGLTTEDLISMCRDKVDRSCPVIVDSARPDVIESLRRSGIKAQPAIKEVKEGIDSVKSREIYLHSDSTAIWDEYGRYLWKTRDDRVIDEPVKINDDGMDAIRYAIHYHKKMKKASKTSFYIG